MSDSEKTEPALSAQDLDDLQKMANEPQKRTLLEVWENVLSNIESSRTKRVDARSATVAIGKWPRMDLNQVPRYNELFFDYLTDLRSILAEEIKSDKSAFSRIEKDAEENRTHYLNLLLNWQLQSLQWEHEWDVMGDEAYIKIAAMEDAHAFVLGQKGLVSHLESINFVMTEDDQGTLVSALQEFETEGERE